VDSPLAARGDDGRNNCSVKEAVRVAKDNNLMGLICSSELLVSFKLLGVSTSTNILQDMVPSLINAVKSEGLVLVTDKTSLGPGVSSMDDPFPKLPEGIDGVLKADGVLKFNETIDM
jgi:CDK inhibitor PHO81